MIMEAWWKYNTFSNFLNSNQILLSWIVLCALSVIIYKWTEKNKNNAKLFSRQIPKLKVTPCSPYGHLKYLPSMTTMKELGLSSVVYIVNLASGLGLIFQKEGIFCFQIAFRQYVVLIKPEYVEVLLSSTVFLEKGQMYDMLHPWLSTGLLTSHGTKWKTRRKLLTHAFHFDILKDFVPVFDKQSKVLVDILKDKTHQEWIEIAQLITLCSLDIICETTLGTHIDAQTNSDSNYVQAVLNASKILAERGTTPILLIESVFRLSSLGQKFKKELERLHSFTRKVIQEKKNALISAQHNSHNSSAEESVNDQCKKKRKALMDLLLDVHMNIPEFSEEDIREEIDTFALEGHDTTSMGMSWALYLIGLYPDVQSKLQEELDVIYGDDHERPVTVEDLKEMPYLERVLKESQRLYPSVPIYSRKAHEDFNICGYQVKKGMEIAVSPYIIHRNSEIFPNPEKFDPDRFLPEKCAGRHPFAYVPFSAGPRNCIGQRFAMMEEKVVISNVLRSFIVKSLEQRDKIVVIPELILRPVHTLKMKLIPRHLSR